MEKQAEKVSFGGAIRNAYLFYGTFGGRSSLSEYWYFWLYSLLAGLAISLLTFVPSVELQVFVAFIAFAFLLVNLVPGLALSVRRLRDAGFSPALLLLVFVPFGGIAVLILCAMESKQTAQTPLNSSGPNSPEKDHGAGVAGRLEELELLHKKGLITKDQLERAKNRELGI